MSWLGSLADLVPSVPRVLALIGLSLMASLKQLGSFCMHLYMLVWYYRYKRNRPARFNHGASELYGVSVVGIKSEDIIGSRQNEDNVLATGHVIADICERLQSFSQRAATLADSCQ